MKQGETAMITGDPWTRFVELLPERYRDGMHRTESGVDTLLAAMARRWTVEELARECTPADLGAGAGVVIMRLRSCANRNPAGREATGLFRQPLPWCGRCDSPRTRWYELTDPDTGKPSGHVVRCQCWTDPPNTSRYAPRCTGCGKPTRLRDSSGRPTCDRCLT